VGFHYFVDLVKNGLQVMYEFVIFVDISYVFGIDTVDRVKTLLDTILLTDVISLELVPVWGRCYAVVRWRKSSIPPNICEMFRVSVNDFGPRGLLPSKKHASSLDVQDFLNTFSRNVGVLVDNLKPYSRSVSL